MASQAHFSRMPSINIPRTKMKMPYKVSTSFQHGDLVPLDAIPVIPGDTLKLKLSSLIRMSNPIRPIMGDIQVDIHAFFVPMRLVWSHTEEFFGENKENAGPQTTVYTIPTGKWRSQSTDDLAKSQAMSVGAYLGKPPLGKTAAGGSMKEIKINALKERAVLLTWNEWYRAQQVENPYLLASDASLEANNFIASRNGSQIDFNHITLPKVNKKWDYYTSATISPQYGQAVEIAIGESAPVELISNAELAEKLSKEGTNPDKVFPGFAYVSGNDKYFAGDGYSLADSNALIFGAGELNNGHIAFNNPSIVGFDNDVVGEGTMGVATPMVYDPQGTLIAKLNEATMVNVNELRYAFALQKWLERSNYGSRYFELLQAHYGVTSPDSRLQRPEHIGSTSFRINVSQVLSTAGSTNTAETKVGEPGANSLTLDVSSLFTKGFVEFGYVVILLDTKHDRSYSQGILREDSYTDRFSFYSPEFASLGDQAILNKEIFADGSSNDEKVFGYQEHWAEMRYRPSRTTGLLNPSVSSSLNFWTLTDHYANLPELSEEFLFEDRDAIARCLVSGESGPDYIADFYFDLTAVRPMPAYTIPGLIDHFGAL